jgi:outer membrane protein TolC
MNKFVAVSALSAATILGAGAQTTATNLVANPAGVREMSLKDCIQTALQYNFDVQIQRENVDIQLYGLNGAYGGYDPTLNISGQHNHDNQAQFTTVTETNGAVVGVVVPQISDVDSFKTDVGGLSPWGLQYDFFGNVAQSTVNSFGSPQEEDAGGQVGVTVTQPLLKNFWIDTTRLTILLAKNSLKESEQGLRLQYITSVAAVQNAYYELIYAQDNVQVQQEALVLAQTQLDQDRQRVAVGSLAPLDVQQDEAQVASSQATLIAARNTLSLDQNTLKSLLVSDYSHWHDTTIKPTESLAANLQLFDLQDCWGKGMTRRPDLLQARLTVESQGITLKYDRNQLYPTLDLNSQYGYNGVGPVYSGAFDQYGDANHPFYYYGASLSFPLSNVKARNTLKSDKATLRQELLTLKQLEQNIMVEIDNAVQQVRSDYEGVQASKQARIYAEAALDAEQKKYAVGKSTTFTVLQLQNTLTADRGAEIRSIANYNEDIAKLAQQEGVTLEDLNINVQFR